MPSTITVIIPSYNYGRFLAEAVDSVLNQSRPVDSIILVNDGSTDDTEEICRSYQRRHPEIIRIISHSENKGILFTFNEAVEYATGDYICFLGADNIMEANYIASCESVLDSDPQVAIAYTDFILFGENAPEVCSSFKQEWRRPQQEDGWPICFPEFNGEASLDILKDTNFIHGSSMYKKQAFLDVGGYNVSSNNGPEDHNLFLRILSHDEKWTAKKATNTQLRYRQHSYDQANIKVQMIAKAKQFDEVVNHWQRDVAELRNEITLRDKEIARLTGELSNLEKQLSRLQQSRAFRLLHRLFS